jgi:hypothetical protein
MNTAKASASTNVIVAAGDSNGYVYVYVYNGVTFSPLWSHYMGTSPLFTGASPTFPTYSQAVGVASVAMSTSGTPLYLAAGLYLTNLTLFNAQTGAVLWSKSIRISESYGGGWSGTESDSVAISANGTYIVAGCTNGIYVYNTLGGLVWSYPVGATCVAISPNGDWVAACNYTNNAIYLFSNPSGTIASGWPIAITGFWVATSDPGYVVFSKYYSDTIYAYNSAGTPMWTPISYMDPVWQKDLVNYIRVGMSQNGEGVVAVNDDPNSNFNCSLCYLNIFVNPPGTFPPDWTFSPNSNPLDKFWSVAISAAANGITIATGPATVGYTWVFPTSTSPATNPPPPKNTFTTTNISQAYALTSDGVYGACGSTNNTDPKIPNSQSGYLYLFNTAGTGTLWSSANLGGNVHTVAISYTAITVGGTVVPVDKLVLLAPYIALASTILIATAATGIYVKRRKKKQ